MTRDDVEYNICYSRYLEKMFSTLTGRIDKCISFLLLLSGSAVFASFGSNIFFGFVVAGLSSISLIYEFGKKSSLALDQSRLYEDLSIIKSTLSDEELIDKFQAINKKDSAAWNCLSVAARKRAIYAIHGDDLENRPYTVLQAVMSWLAGDKP